MKYVVASVMAVFVLFMGVTLVVGFVQKQQAESNLQNTTPNTQGNQTPSSVASQNSYSSNEVSKHNTPNDCWIIISNKVYDVAKFLDIHPGGADVIIPYCGKDATQAFDTQGGRRRGHSNSARQLLDNYLIGDLR